MDRELKEATQTSVGNSPGSEVGTNEPVHVGETTFVDENQELWQQIEESLDLLYQGEDVPTAKRRLAAATVKEAFHSSIREAHKSGLSMEETFKTERLLQDVTERLPSKIPSFTPDDISDLKQNASLAILSPQPIKQQEAPPIDSGWIPPSVKAAFDASLAESLEAIKAVPDAVGQPVKPEKPKRAPRQSKPKPAALPEVAPTAEIPKLEPNVVEAPAVPAEPALPESTQEIEEAIQAMQSVPSGQVPLKPDTSPPVKITTHHTDPQPQAAQQSAGSPSVPTATPKAPQQPKTQQQKAPQAKSPTVPSASVPGSQKTTGEQKKATAGGKETKKETGKVQGVKTKTPPEETVDFMTPVYGYKKSPVLQGRTSQDVGSNEVALRESKFLYHTEVGVVDWATIGVPESQISEEDKIAMDEIHETYRVAREEPQTVPAEAPAMVPVEQMVEEMIAAYDALGKGKKQPEMEPITPMMPMQQGTPAPTLNNPVVAEAARIGRTGTISASKIDKDVMNVLHNEEVSVGHDESQFFGTGSSLLSPRNNLGRNS